MSEAPEEEERRLRIELMETQIKLYRKQEGWETWKVITTIAGVVIAAFGAGSAFTLAVIALLNYLHGQP
jgi:hypothetical protein